MTQKITVALKDDLDGGPADETLRFGIGGSDFEIDLSKKNATVFRRQFAPFIEHARKTGSGERRPGRTAASRERSENIRAWAKGQGIAVSDRGRIPASVVEQYQAATRKLRSKPGSLLIQANPLHPNVAKIPLRRGDLPART
jgi:Lsr2